MKQTLRLILGDQLNSRHPWFEQVESHVTYLMMEMRQETDYMQHHVQKIVGFFLAMRNFAESLQADGHRVIYLKLDDETNRQTLTDNLKYLIDEYDIEIFEYQFPDEYRLDNQLRTFCENLKIESQAVDSHHFLTTRNELSEFFSGKKQYLMERFYRYMREKHDVLMDDSEPVGGDWNYDDQNRKKLPASVSIPEPKQFDKEVSDVVKMVQAAGIKTIGSIDEKAFPWPVTREESLELLDYFVEHLLPQFGDYQDAMTDRGWSLFHSRLSFSLNTKMLSPREVIDACEEHWRANQEEIHISQTEGFIRQILGWREYMRGMYWAFMPDYAAKNFLNHQRALPEFYWTGKTKMKCLSHTIGQSLEKAYAHHIQRLMVTGNFALLAGVDPDAVDRWYLGIYIDAIQWVEITNTRGMSQFADGGLIATKPYVSSANYMNKMSDYCKDCHYAHTKKTGDKACPFNSMYWHFIARNEKTLGDNPRMGMMYRVWGRYDEKKQKAILDQAEAYLENLDEL